MALGLQLDIYSTEILLETAGYSFAKSEVTDQIIKELIITHKVIKNKSDYLKLLEVIQDHDPNSYFIK